MLRASLIIAVKDLRLLLMGGGGLVQSLFLGLILIFMFSLSRTPDQVISLQSASTIFWLSSAFCLVLAGNMCYNIEENNKAKFALLLINSPRQSIFLAKFIAILIVLFLAQLVFLPAVAIFLNQTFDLNHSIIAIIMVDLGLAILGALLGALACGSNNKDTLLSLILFPLLIPLLLAGIKLLTAWDISWFNLCVGFDLIFMALALLLYPFIYDED